MAIRSLRHALPAILLLLLLPGVFSDCGGPVMVTGNIINLSGESFRVIHGDWSTVVRPQSFVEIRYLTVIKSKNMRRDARKFDCCPCNTTGQFTIMPVDSSKTLIKDFTNPASWTITRETKAVSCDFEIRASDVR
jgi:hypothetical protein